MNVIFNISSGVTAIKRPDHLETQVGFLLKLALNTVWSDVTATLEPFGLRPAGYAALTVIEANPGCKQQDVADLLAIQRPNVVALIDGLVSRGWIRRSVNPGDRRSNNLKLSPAGRQHLALARNAHAAHEARIAAALSPAKRRALLGSLKTLAHLSGSSLPGDTKPQLDD